MEKINLNPTPANTGVVAKSVKVGRYKVKYVRILIMVALLLSLIFGMRWFIKAEFGPKVEPILPNVGPSLSLIHI